MAYSRNKDLAKRHVANKILAEKAHITATDSTLGERTAIWTAMKAKTKMGLKRRN